MRPRHRASPQDQETALRRATFPALAASLEIAEIDATVFERAAADADGTGTLDAIRPATDLFRKESTGVELVMATHDVALALAAQAHGLAVEGVSRP